MRIIQFKAALAVELFEKIMSFLSKSGSLGPLEQKCFALMVWSWASHWDKKKYKSAQWIKIFRASYPNLKITPSHIKMGVQVGHEGRFAPYLVGFIFLIEELEAPELGQYSSLARRSQADFLPVLTQLRLLAEPWVDDKAGSIEKIRQNYMH